MQLNVKPLALLEEIPRGKSMDTKDLCATNVLCSSRCFSKVLSTSVYVCACLNIFILRCRYLHELTDYGWDQSPKYVKLFITLNGVQNCPEEAVTVNYTEHSLQLHVRDLNGKDFGLTVNNLLYAIDVEKSYRKVKTDMVAIYLKKAQEGQDWDVLTSIQKRLKQKQDSELTNDSNPESSLVNMMKKMYNSGDTKTKQMIAKVWTESQERARFGQEGLGNLGNLADI